MQACKRQNELRIISMLCHAAWDYGATVHVLCVKKISQSIAGVKWVPFVHYSDTTVITPAFHEEV